MKNMNRHFVLDVEANGPIIGRHSMIQFALVGVEDHSDNFYGELSPLTEHYHPDALASIGLSHEETQGYAPAATTMSRFASWLTGKPGRLYCWSDNPAFDWGWLNWYMWTFLGGNTLGWSCRRIGDLDSGMTGDLRSHRWRKYKKTAHTHNALDDATGNAEALKVLFNQLSK